MTPVDSAGHHGPAEQVAWAWVDHLRSGGTTPWRDFRTDHGDDHGADHGVEPVSEPGGRQRGRLPGAAQLELARLLVERAADRPGPDADRRGALVERALERSGPGRGLLELPLDLTGDVTGASNARVGPPATDPADVPTEELVRVGVGLLVAELLRTDVATDPAWGRADADAGSSQSHRRRPFSRRFWVAGAPTTTAGVRAALADAGHLGGGRTPEVVLLALPLERMLGEVWSGRVQRGAPVSWPAFVERWSRRDALPPSADLPALARSWAERVGAGRVHVVADQEPLHATAQLLGIRLRPTSRPALPELLAMPSAAVDLLRRVNQVLGVRVPEARQPALRRVVAASSFSRSRMSPDVDEARLVVPELHRSWAEAQSARVVEELRRGGYPVHGDLDLIAVRPGGPQRPRRSEVLDLVLDTVLRVVERQG
ncbi:MAG: hypothetical protein H0V42_05935 [Nocardioidaceae bacterium]|nr:hypothetical protein [Nocardioidaceae bacterium]